MWDKDGKEIIGLIEEYLNNPLGDGLPIFPPVPELIEQAVAATGRPADEVVGSIPPKGDPATVRDIARCAIMAGCRPEYTPVVLAAVRAMAGGEFDWLHMSISTKGVAPLMVVNGPIRNALGMNARGNVFGPGNRPTATIGRAIRLITNLLGEAMPQAIDMSTLGHPGKFTYCIAEDEEDSPWEPYHVSRGYSPEQSTVFIHACEAPKQITVWRVNQPDAILVALVDMLTPLGAYPIVGPTELVVILSKEHRETLANAGFTRRKLQEYLYEHAYRRAGDLRKVYCRWEAVQEAPSDDEPIRILKRPEDVHIFAAGGPGAHSAVCHGLTTTCPSTIAVIE